MRAWKLLLLLWTSWEIFLLLGLKRHGQLSPQGWYRKVCGNTAVIAGDPEKRETKALSLPPARTHLDCCAGWADFSIPKLVYLPRLLAGCTWGGPTAIGADNLTSFPSTRNNQVLFPPWKERWEDILCALNRKGHENCKGQVALFLSFVQQWLHCGDFKWARCTLAEDHAHGSRLYSILHHRISKCWLNLTICPGFGWDRVSFPPSSWYCKISTTMGMLQTPWLLISYSISC